MSLITFYILAIIFIATLVRSTFGFGESLVAVPLLVLLIPIEIAVPLSVLISILIAAFIVVQDRKQIHFNSVKWLIALGHFSDEADSARRLDKPKRRAI